jgi:hypothetical protein
MFGRKLRIALALLAVGTSLTLAGTAAAGRCSALKCKNEIAACHALTGCDALETRRLKRACKRACKQGTKASCKASTLDCSLSPSGAFLDAPQ